MLKTLKTLNLKIYLETNSTFPKKLKKIVSYLDVICANFKIEEKLIPSFKKTIQICKNYHKEFFVKMVISDREYDERVVTKTIQMFKQNKCNLLILQQESDKYKIRDKKLFTNLSLWYHKLNSYFKSVHIIPQTHKFVWKIR
ncbi:MAG: hypothetical protein SNJ64_06175 [Endomicrobiia bacterium]